MTQNRPWSVWWNFTREINDTVPSHIIIQSDHPDYQHIHYIYRFPITECEDSAGHVDSWVEDWFNPFRDNLTSGRESIHTLMKTLGYKKETSGRN